MIVFLNEEQTIRLADVLSALKPLSSLIMIQAKEFYTESVLNQYLNISLVDPTKTSSLLISIGPLQNTEILSTQSQSNSTPRKSNMRSAKLHIAPLLAACTRKIKGSPAPSKLSITISPATGYVLVKAELGRISRIIKIQCEPTAFLTAAHSPPARYPFRCSIWAEAIQNAMKIMESKTTTSLLLSTQDDGHHPSLVMQKRSMSKNGIFKSDLHIVFPFEDFSSFNLTENNSINIEIDKSFLSVICSLAASYVSIVHLAASSEIINSVCSLPFLAYFSTNLTGAAKLEVKGAITCLPVYNTSDVIDGESTSSQDTSRLSDANQDDT